MTQSRRRVLSVALAGAAWLAAAAAALPPAVAAHALLRSSIPAAGATLGAAPDSVRLVFTEPPDPRLSTIHVLASGGDEVAVGTPRLVSGQPTALEIGVAHLPDGVYTVSWRVVSAIDGHATIGSFAFGIGAAPPAPNTGAAAGGTSDSGSPPAVLLRWILYAGLLLLLGAAFIVAWAGASVGRDLLALTTLGWGLAGVGTFGVVATQWIESGAPIEAIPGSSVGIAGIARIVALAILGLAAAGVALAGEHRRRPAWALLGAAAGAAVAVDVVTGHAAAADPPLPQLVAQWVHGVSAGIWLGGLAALLVALRSTPVDARLPLARRFSSGATVAILAIAVTGVVRAVDEVGTIDRLATSDFGRVVVVKAALLVLLALLGAANRFWVLRSAARLGAGWLHRVGSVEVATAVVVIALSALLVNLTPPASATSEPPPQAAPVMTSGHDFGTSVRLRLTVTPGGPGSNSFHATATDFDSGQPVAASGLSMRFSLLSATGVGESTLQLDPASAGEFSATGTNLSIDGVWRLTATVTLPRGAVEVPLVLATRVAEQPVTQVATPGAPTIYTVQLGSRGSLQVYLDPGAAGSNELHATFFDPAGAELAVPSATIATWTTDGAGQLLQSRTLEPGHFAAAVDAIAGPLGVDIVAPPPPDAAGGQIHAHVTIEVQP